VGIQFHDFIIPYSQKFDAHDNKCYTTPWILELAVGKVDD